MTPNKPKLRIFVFIVFFHPFMLGGWLAHLAWIAMEFGWDSGEDFIDAAVEKSVRR